ncbi:MAG: NADPH-dependent 7-cyano-7-deazaguanine reductase QueF [Endozoicomonas sp. (ex Botrylloides leachii)]|nr:NADPH-dependent 7-cyano-7-deazaguanine reductase QueF [Endozoicomonas sp. (ex Botrylloides leachii)]
MDNMLGKLDNSPLGKKSQYETQYNPDLLFPITREGKRKALGLNLQSLPFYGRDLWYAYELSWLDTKGKPMVRIGAFELPFDTPNIIESKSFKLYLNSFNQTVFADEACVHRVLTKDLSAAAGGDISITLMTIEALEAIGFHQAPGKCLDDMDIEVNCYDYAPSLLKKAGGQAKEVLCSHLLKSNCLVTGQPDWGSLVIEYEGEAIDHASLLQYICSFREHHEFHEQCVERVFTDLINAFQLYELTVYAQYIRRGGLDINPWRSTKNIIPEQHRFIRQ